MLTARGWRCQPFELSEAEQQTLLRLLVRGPRRAGPTLDRWTFGRMVELFRQEYGIRYHPSLIRKALTGLETFLGTAGAFPLRLLHSGPSSANSLSSDLRTLLGRQLLRPRLST